VENQPTPHLSSQSEYQLDLAFLEEYLELLELMTPFQLFRKGDLAELRNVADLKEVNTAAREQLVRFYAAFRDILAVAAAQQAMISGSAIADEAAKTLRATNFGAWQDDCRKIDVSKELFPAVRCKAAEMADSKASKVQAAKAKLAAAKSDEEAATARADLNQLRVDVRTGLAQSDGSPTGDLLAKAFKAVDDLRSSRQCVAYESEELSRIDERLRSASDTDGGKRFWEYAQLTCLIEVNPTFSKNVAKVLVLQEMKSRARTYYDYMAASRMNSHTVMRGLLPDLNFSWNVTRGTGQWQVEFRDALYWTLGIGLPLWVEVEAPREGDTDPHRVLSNETEAHRLISLLRNRVDNKLVELTACTQDGFECDDSMRRLMVNALVRPVGGK